MRKLAVSTALLAVTVSLFSMTSAASAQTHHAKMMTVKLENGQTATFHIMKMGGKMMAVMSYDDFMAAFRQYLAGPHNQGPL